MNGSWLLTEYVPGKEKREEQWRKRLGLPGTARTGTKGIHQQSPDVMTGATSNG